MQKQHLAGCTILFLGNSHTVFNDHFKGDPGLFSDFSFTCSGSDFLGITGTGFTGEMHLLSANQQCQSIKGNSMH